MSDSTLGQSQSWKTVNRYHELSDLIRAHPKNPEAWLEFAYSRLFRYETEEAANAFRRAVELSPRETLPSLELGLCLAGMTSYNRSLSAEPDYDAYAKEAIQVLLPLVNDPLLGGRALTGIGAAEFRLGDFDKGIEYLMSAAQRYPGSAVDIWNTAARMPRSYPGMLELIDLLLRANKDPGLAMRIKLSAGCVELTEGEWEQERIRVEWEVDDLLRNMPAAIFDTSMWNVLRQTEIDPRGCEILPLREKLSRFFSASFPELNHVAPEVSRRLSAPHPKRLRLGFLMHRSWDVDFGSILANLFSRIDKKRFELVLLYNDRSLKENMYSQQVRELVDELVLFPLSDWRQFLSVVSGAKLDVLVHETCICTMTFAGFARLAPVQCGFVDCSHSLASPQTDYLFGYGSLERFHSMTLNSRESVAHFPGMVAVTAPDRVVPAEMDRREFGIPDGVRLFLVYEGIHRWREQDDPMIGQLLRRYPDAWLLARHDVGMLTKLVERRWREKTLSDVADRIRFFHFLPTDRLFGVMNKADSVLLTYDPGTFSSLTLLGQDIPSPICRDVYGICQHSSTHYEYMDIPDLIAKDREDYVRIHCRLLDDPDWRESKTREIRAKKHLVFANDAIVDEVQDFFENAYMRARRGIPSTHWSGGKFLT